MKKLKIFFDCIKFFFRLMVEYPKDIKENFEDAVSKYRTSTDDEITKLIEEIDF